MPTPCVPAPVGELTSPTAVHAVQAGDYSFCFSNQFSTVAHKTVSYSCPFSPSLHFPSLSHIPNAVIASLLLPSVMHPAPSRPLAHSLLLGLEVGAAIRANTVFAFGVCVRHLRPVVSRSFQGPSCPPTTTTKVLSHSESLSARPYMPISRIFACRPAHS